MAKPTNGGPAFPRPGYYPPETNLLRGDALRERLPTVTEPQGGMTYLDWLIGQALMGLMANAATGADMARISAFESSRAAVEAMGTAAVGLAVATLKARDRFLAAVQKEDSGVDSQPGGGQVEDTPPPPQAP